MFGVEFDENYIFPSDRVFSVVRNDIWIADGGVVRGVSDDMRVFVCASTTSRHLCAGCLFPVSTALWQPISAPARHCRLAGHLRAFPTGRRLHRMFFLLHASFTPVATPIVPPAPTFTSTSASQPPPTTAARHHGAGRRGGS